MGGIVVPWVILIAFDAWAYGYERKQLPEPFRFFWGTVAMGLAGIVAQADDRVGTLFAWALLAGAFAAYYNENQTLSPKALANKAQTTGGTQPTTV